MSRQSNRGDFCENRYFCKLRKEISIMKALLDRTNYDLEHYSDVIMSTIASQITGVSIIYPTVCSGADEGKQQSSASLTFVRGIHRWPANSRHKRSITRKMFPFDDVIMKTSPYFVGKDMKWKCTKVSCNNSNTSIRKTQFDTIISRGYISALIYQYLHKMVHADIVIALLYTYMYIYWSTVLPSKCASYGMPLYSFAKVSCCI